MEWQEEAIKKVNADSFETLQKPNYQFKDYRDGFNDLIHIQTIACPKIRNGENYDQAFIVSCLITNDSQTAITIIKTWDREYWVYMYDLTSSSPADACKPIFQE